MSSVAESFGIWTRRNLSSTRTKYPPNVSSVFAYGEGVLFNPSTTVNGASKSKKICVLNVLYMPNTGVSFNESMTTLRTYCMEYTSSDATESGRTTISI